MVNIFEFAREHNVEVRVRFEERTGCHLVRMSRAVNNVEMIIDAQKLEHIDVILEGMLADLERIDKEYEERIAELKRRLSL